MNAAVFYDFENIGLSSIYGGFEQTMLALRKKMEASGFIEKIVLQRGYISKGHTAVPRMQPVLEKLGVELVLVNPLYEDVRSKANMVDFKMGVDVIATILPKRSVTTVVIASGDNDFGFLCQQIKALKRNLLVISRFNTTGMAMMRFCDDWIDLSEQKLTPKFIMRAIQARLPKTAPSGHFHTDFNAFLQALSDDTLLRRYMTECGLDLQKVVLILHQRRVYLPKYDELGLASQTAFFELLFGKTNFECTKGMVRFCAHKKPATNHNMIVNVMRIPSGYTREKLMMYHDCLNSVDNIEELMIYIHFMKRNSLIFQNHLRPKESLRDTFRDHLLSVLSKAGLTADESVLADLEDYV